MSRPHPATVVILAVGQGTRVKSEILKVLHPMCGCTLLGHAVFTARGLTPDHIAVVVRHEHDRVAAHITECDPGIMIAGQDEIRGTGRTLWCGLHTLPADLPRPVVMTTGGAPLLSTDVLLRLLGRHEGNVVTVLTAVAPDPTGYGRIVRNAEGTVAGVVEHKDATQEQREVAEINTSMYVSNTDSLHGAISGLDTESMQGETYLTNIVAKAYESGVDVGSYVVEDSWLVEGHNDLVQLVDLWEQMNRGTLKVWMRSGATIVDPATTSINVTVALAPGCRILPGTGLYGTTSIAKGALVGPGKFTDALMGGRIDARHVAVRDAAVETRTALPPYTVLTGGARAAGVSEQRGEL